MPWRWPWRWTASRGIHAIACDTDGVDGAAEVAGALIGPDTLARGVAAGLDAAAALARNDAHSYFAAQDRQVVTGPTLTNVNDFRAILVRPPTDGGPSAAPGKSASASENDIRSQSGQTGAPGAAFSTHGRGTRPHRTGPAHHRCASRACRARQALTLRPPRLPAAFPE